ARARVRARALAPQRQAAAGGGGAGHAAGPQPVDVHRRLAPQGAPDPGFSRHAPAPPHLRARAGPDPRPGGHECPPVSAPDPAAADPENMRQSDADVLVGRDVDACDTCHAFSLSWFLSTLPLLVARVLANHSHDAAAPDDLALPTNLANRCPDFHRETPAAPL